MVLNPGMWVNLFKNVPSKICGRPYHFKNLKAAFHKFYLVDFWIPWPMCHYIVIVDNDHSHKIILNNKEITSSNEEKLLGILLDSKLSFDSHIKTSF